MNSHQQIPWMSQSNVNLDDCHNVKNLWISQSEINFHHYRNVTMTLLHVTSWHILWCTSQFHINIHECHNATPTLMMSHVTLPFMNIEMWYQLPWMSQSDLHQHQFWWLSQCDINFVECCNVTSTWINAMWCNVRSKLQWDIPIILCHNWSDVKFDDCYNVK